MKKLLFVFTAMCIALLSVMSFSAFAADGVNVTVNGEAIEFDASPVIISGRTMIPARAVFEKMGATVLWDPYSEGGYVSVITPDESVVVFASAAGGENYMVKDNFKKIGLDSPAVIREGRTLVPLRAISEAFGAGVSWDGETRTAAITFEPVEKGLDEATVSANEAVLFEDAEKEISAKDGEAEVSPMPMYENGSKFYRGVCAKEQKQYKYGSDKTASESEYKLYGTINGKVIPYNEFEYYLKVVKDNALYSGEELSEESAKEKAEKEMFFLRVAAAKSEADGVETDKEFYDTADYFSRMMTYGFPEKEYCQMTGLDYETFNNIIEMYALRNSLIDKLAKDGTIDISDEAIKSEFSDKFVKVKHILFKTVDDDRNKLDDKQTTEKKKLAEDTLKKIKNGEDFDKLMSDLSEDPGLASNPEGYVFTDGEMVSEFENAAKALKVDEVSDIIETTYGYHILKRVALDPEKEADSVNSYSSSIVNGIIVDYMEKNIDAWKSGMEITAF